MRGYGWISLTTDYGTFDGFVASCHGVIARIAPDVRVIDVTHHVPPADVPRGAAVLAQTALHLPEAVHMAVVDPGVGTSRRAVAIGTPNGVLVGPDNGVLIWAAEALGGIDEVVHLANKEWFLGDQTFIGGESPSIADIRLAATLEFLRAIDYDLPGWAEDYISAMESALGDAYSEPAADVRGYIEYVRSQAVPA